jgi:hypothetical protein
MNHLQRGVLLQLHGVFNSKGVAFTLQEYVGIYVAKFNLNANPLRRSVD